MDEQKLVLMVCLGNICRSPIACAVFKHIVKSRGIDGKWKCDSAGTGSWHIGDSMDHRSAEVLTKHGVDATHSARQVKAADFKIYDYIFGMDHENIRNLKHKTPAGSKATIELLGTYDPEGGVVIRDPYYDHDLSGFEECYEKSVRACNAFLDKFN